MKKMSLFLFSFLLVGCSNITVLDPKSTTGKDQAYLIWFSLAIMSIVILVVFVLFTHFVIKYRLTKARQDVLPTDVKGNKKLELTYTIIPIILLIILAIPTVRITLDQSPNSEAAQNQDGVNIDVIARQFEWKFTHDNNKQVTDELVIPEGEPIVLHLQSEDVIHSFWVPELAGKVDVIPGQEITYVIEDPETGTYEGKCAEFCGVQHTNMTFTVKVVSDSNYKDYLDSDD